MFSTNPLKNERAAGQGGKVKRMVGKFQFKRGQQVHLDDIYIIQGLFSELEWWQAIDPSDAKLGDQEELVTITRDIEITIMVKTK